MTASTRRAALGAILAAPLASAPALAGPSDLAQTCDAAVARMAWVNDATHAPEEWPDERVAVEMDRFDDVLLATAVQPSRCAADRAAKARLLLCDWRSAICVPEANPGERALLAFLEEVAACA